MRKLQITNSTALNEILKGLVNESEELRYLHRIHVVSLVAKGCSCHDVAAWYELTIRTVERWVHQYDTTGCSGLRGDQNSGRPHKLSASELEIISRDIKKSPRDLGYKGERWKGGVLAVHLRKFFDVSLSERQCQRLIKQYGSLGGASGYLISSR